MNSYLNVTSFFWVDNNGSVSAGAPVDDFVSVGSWIVTVFFGGDKSGECFSSLCTWSSAGLSVLDVFVVRAEP
jgi:hypothetical protein